MMIWCFMFNVLGLVGVIAVYGFVCDYVCFCIVLFLCYYFDINRWFWMELWRFGGVLRGEIVALGGVFGVFRGVTFGRFPVFAAIL